MIIEYCEKCSVRLEQDDGVVDPATSACYCLKCAAQIPALAPILKERSQPKPAARKSSRRLPAVQGDAPASPVARRTPAGDTPAVSRKTPAAGTPVRPAVPPPAFSQTDGNMAFYFCESCGRRLTASDLDAGRARDKQIKGVYCVDCAKGVNTVSFDAISMKDAAAIRRDYKLGEVAPTAGALAAQYAGRRKGPAGAPATASGHPARNSPVALAATLGLGAAGLFVILFALLRSGSSSVTAAKTGEEPNTPAKRVPANSPSPAPGPIVEAKPAKPVAAPATTQEATVQAIATPTAASDDPARNYTRRAEAVLADAMKFYAVNPENRGDYKKRLESVVADFPSASAAQDARALIAKLNAAETPRREEAPATEAPRETTARQDEPQPKAAVPAAADVSVAQAESTLVSFKQPLLKPGQREAVQAYDRVLERLAAVNTSQLARMNDAAALASSLKHSELDGMAALLTRGAELYKEGLRVLAAKTPAEEIQIQNKKLSMKGKILRIEGEKAWVRAQGLEMPLAVSALPEAMLFQAMGVQGGDEKAQHGRLCYALASGNVEGALQSARAEGHAWSVKHEHLAVLKRLCAFEDLEKQIEGAIAAADVKQGERYLETMRKTLPDEVQAHAERVLFLQQRLRLSEGAPPQDPAQANSGTGTFRPGLWLGYWLFEGDNWFKSFLVSAVTPGLQMPWTAASPTEGVPLDFAARFHGLLMIAQKGTYQFKASVDDEVRIYIDRKLCELETAVTLDAGLHELRIDFLDHRGTARLHIQWMLPGKNEWTEIPAGALWHDTRFIESYKKN